MPVCVQSGIYVLSGECRGSLGSGVWWRLGDGALRFYIIETCHWEREKNYQIMCLKTGIKVFVNVYIAFTINVYYSVIEYV